MRKLLGGLNYDVGALLVETIGSAPLELCTLERYGLPTVTDMVGSDFLRALTVNCGRFTEERPVVPCLAFGRLIDEGIICACEGDITAMLSSLMLHAVSGQSILMGNFGSRPGWFEAKEGEVTIEHDVIPLSMASAGFTVRDYHGRKFGVTGYAQIKITQPMTILNLDSSLDKISVIGGRIKGSEDGIHCRIIVHMSVDGDITRVSKIIVGSQHVSMSFGDWLGAFKNLGDLLDLEVRYL